jgi:hypothetical protein
MFFEKWTALSIYVLAVMSKWNGSENVKYALCCLTYLCGVEIRILSRFWEPRHTYAHHRWSLSNLYNQDDLLEVYSISEQASNCSDLAMVGTDDRGFVRLLHVLQSQQMNFCPSHLSLNHAILLYVTVLYISQLSLSNGWQGVLVRLEHVWSGG